MDEKWKANVQEGLLSLYLRLNGYFVSGFIVHSPVSGKNLTEIDLLAVRFPQSREPERQVDADPLLEPSSEMIDLAICEVKGGRPLPRFNSSLLSSSDRVSSLLRWAGLHSESEIADLAPRVIAAFTPTESPQPKIPTVLGPRGTRVRGLICCPDRAAPRNNQSWFIPGSAMLAFLSRCFCPAAPRTTCATAYDFGLWHEHESIVRYIKAQGHANAGTMEDLYTHLSAPVTS